MNPIKLKGSNATWAVDQPQYEDLPAINLKDSNGTVITCWSLNDEELMDVSKNRCLYLAISTFHQPLQPVLLSTKLEELVIFPTAQEYYKARLKQFKEHMKEHDLLKFVSLDNKTEDLMTMFATFLHKPENINTKPPFKDEI
jgi:hypothetical protein